MNKNKKTTRYLWVVCVAVVFALVLMFTATAQTSLEKEDGTPSLYTEDILNQADISLGKYDKVIRTDSDGCVSLSVVRAFEVEIDYMGEKLVGYSTGGSVREAVESAGVTLTGAEDVTPPLATLVSEGMVITVEADCEVTLTADGETVTVISKGATVESLLDDMGIVLGGDDIVTPPLDTRLSDCTEIVVQRVEYKEETTTEIIDYGFVSEETASLQSGTSKIKQYGIEGERTIVSKNKYVDGVLTESEIISDEVTREPQDQIKLIGTGYVASAPSYSKPSGGASVSNAAGTFTDASGNTVSYVKKLTGTSTAYYAPPGALTATGVPAYLGGVAVNPNVIPYGSKLYIVASNGSICYGYATAVDTGGALMSGSVLVDVYYPTYNQCVNWGRRNVTVYVLS